VIIWGREQFAVESRSRPGEFHVTERDDETGEWACSCLGYVRWGRCWHVRAVESKPMEEVK